MSWLMYFFNNLDRGGKDKSCNIYYYLIYKLKNNLFLPLIFINILFSLNSKIFDRKGVLTSKLYVMLQLHKERKEDSLKILI